MTVLEATVSSLFASVNKDSYYVKNGVNGANPQSNCGNGFTEQGSVYYSGDNLNRSIYKSISAGNFRVYAGQLRFQCNNWVENCQIVIYNASIFY